MRHRIICAAAAACMIVAAARADNAGVCVAPLDMAPDNKRMGILSHEIYRQHLVATLTLLGDQSVYDLALHAEPDAARDTLTLSLDNSVYPPTVRIAGGDGEALLTQAITDRFTDLPRNYPAMLDDLRERVDGAWREALGEAWLSRAWEPGDRGNIDIDRLRQRHSQGDMLGAFQLLRELHALMATHGPIPELLSLTGRSYAVLGRAMAQTSSDEAVTYIARAMVYANLAKMVAPDDTQVDIDRAFVFAFVGRENDALAVLHALPQGAADDIDAQAIAVLCRYREDAFPQDATTMLHDRMRAIIALSCDDTADTVAPTLELVAKRNPSMLGALFEARLSMSVAEGNWYVRAADPLMQRMWVTLMGIVPLPPEVMNAVGNHPYATDTSSLVAIAAALDNAQDDNPLPLRAYGRLMMDAAMVAWDMRVGHMVFRWGVSAESHREDVQALAAAHRHGALLLMVIDRGSAHYTRAGETARALDVDTIRSAGAGILWYERVRRTVNYSDQKPVWQRGAMWQNDLSIELMPYVRFVSQPTYYVDRLEQLSRHHPYAVLRALANQRDEAAALIPRFADRFEHLPQWHYACGSAYEYTTPARAEMHFRRAIEMQPQQLQAYKTLQAMLRRLDRDEDANAVALSYFDHGPQTVSAVHMRNDVAASYFAQQRYEDALEQYKIGYVTRQAGTIMGVGRCLEAMGKLDEAAAYYYELADHYDSSIDTYMMFAHRHDRAADQQRASQLLAELMDDVPVDKRTREQHQLVALDHFVHERYAEGAKVTQQAIDADPDNASEYDYLLKYRMHVLSGDEAQAAATFEAFGEVVHKYVAWQHLHNVYSGKVEPSATLGVRFSPRGECVINYLSALRAIDLGDTATADQLLALSLESEQRVFWAYSLAYRLKADLSAEPPQADGDDLLKQNRQNDADEQ